ncbi:hypothetical protein L486_02197 [Kwoniella mangroviensis CBS 10435]|uniref:Uncharacterized protein n=1 Tax=Kwoniella mangroviensis CBS 10435 TaxID=1331196 RepID=A0A1B9IVG8_9TREE|nr:hypothetical protein L486_02197 [Kwoniella mangroviensis CBS 10435]
MLKNKLWEDQDAEEGGLLCCAVDFDANLALGLTEDAKLCVVTRRWKMPIDLETWVIDQVQSTPLCLPDNWIGMVKAKASPEPIVVSCLEWNNSAEQAGLGITGTVKVVTMATHFVYKSGDALVRAEKERTRRTIARERL